MHRLVSDIKIGHRFRKQMGDIEGLAKSIESIGLLHPVVVDSANNLIAGERRIKALLFLGRVKIPVTVVDLAEIVRGEFAENSEREDFTLSEAVEIKRAVEPLLKAEAIGRMALGGKLKGEAPAKLAGVKGRAHDKVAKRTGRKRSTLAKAEKVVAAAAADPEKFGHLVERMDLTGSPTAALRMINQKMDEARVLALAPVIGKFPTLVIDPPWDYEWLSLAGRAAPGYATMTHDELMALDVAQWARDDCAMYLWVTNNFMTRGVELMKQWGFQHKTVLTWVKPRIGLGSYFRNSTEHVLFGMRGDVGTRRDDIPTHFEAPTTGHSIKPEKFYEIVRAASYPSYGEIFQREARPDFKNLYQTKVMIEAGAAA